MADQASHPRAGTASNFIERATNVFQAELIQPMCQRAGECPDDVRQVVAMMRRKLDAIETLLPEVPADASLRPSNGVAFEIENAACDEDGEDGASDNFDDIGRNQRSRLRELTLLEHISRENRPFSLQQILGALNAKGFGDSSGAVVSQLHRLKKNNAIHQPAGGMYAITDEGLSHLHKLRSSVGALVGDAR